MTEDQLHKAIYGYLRAILPHGWIVMHVPNGGSRSASEGANFKKLGLMAGWPDLSIYGPQNGDGTPTAYFMEVKTGKGRLKPSQVSTNDRLKAIGFDVDVVRSIDDARGCLNRWGIPTRESLGAWEPLSVATERVIARMAHAYKDAAE